MKTETVTVSFPYSGPPNLIDNLQVVAVEGSTNTVSLSQTPDAFPFPQQFSWTVNGSAANNNSRSFGYPSVTFRSYNRRDTGTYILTATNYRLDNTNVVVGMDTGSFILDVQCKSIWCGLASSQVPGYVTILNLAFFLGLHQCLLFDNLQYANTEGEGLGDFVTTISHLLLCVYLMSLHVKKSPRPSPPSLL